MEEREITKNSENKLATYALIAAIATVLVQVIFPIAVVLEILAYRKAKTLNGIGMGKVKISGVLMLAVLVMFLYGFFYYFQVRH